MITKENIINYFKEAGILDKVRTNIAKSVLGTTYTLEELLDTIFKFRFRPEGILQSMFDMRSTEEGYNYWSDQNDKYVAWVKEQTPSVEVNAILQAFLKFLDDRNIREKFEINRKNDRFYRDYHIRPDTTVEAFVQRVCSQSQILNPRNLVSYAFSWIDTSEGQAYWDNISNEWEKIYENLKSR